jgi:hypothetical protein
MSWPKGLRVIPAVCRGSLPAVRATGAWTVAVRRGSSGADGWPGRDHIPLLVGADPNLGLDFQSLMVIARGAALPPWRWACRPDDDDLAMVIEAAARLGELLCLWQQAGGANGNGEPATGRSPESLQRATISPSCLVSQCQRS